MNHSTLSLAKLPALLAAVVALSSAACSSNTIVPACHAGTLDSRDAYEDHASRLDRRVSAR